MKALRAGLGICLLLLLVGCGADSLFNNEESDDVFVDIVNVGSTRIVFVSFSIIPVIRPADSQNELQTEGLNPDETMRFSLSCLPGSTQYLHLRWENGALRNYEIATPCGSIVTYQFPQ